MLSRLCVVGRSSAMLAAVAGGLMVCSGSAWGQATIDWIKATETNAISISGRSDGSLVYSGGGSAQYIVWDDLHTGMGTGSTPGFKLEFNVPGIGGTGPYKLRYYWTDWDLQATDPVEVDAASGTYAVTALPETCGLYKLTVCLVDSTGTVVTNTVTLNEVALTYQAPVTSTSSADYPGFALNGSTSSFNAGMLRTLAGWISGQSTPDGVGIALMDKMRERSQVTGSSFTAGHAWLYSAAYSVSGLTSATGASDIARQLLVGNGLTADVVPIYQRRTLCDGWASSWVRLVRLAGVRNAMGHHYTVASGKDMLLPTKFWTPSGMRDMQMFDGRTGNVWLSDGTTDQSSSLPKEDSDGGVCNAVPAMTPAADYTVFPDHAIAGINLYSGSTLTSHLYVDPSFGIYWYGAGVTTSIPTTWWDERTTGKFAHVQALEDRVFCYADLNEEHQPRCVSGSPKGHVRQFYGGLYLMKAYQASNLPTAGNHSQFGYWILSRPDQPDNPFDAYVDSSVLQSPTVTALSPTPCDLPVRVRLRAQTGVSVDVRAWAMIAKGTGLLDYKWSRNTAAQAIGFDTDTVSATVNSSGDTDLEFRFPGAFLATLTATTPLKVYYSVAAKSSVNANYNSMTQGSTGSTEFQNSGNPLVRGEFSFTLQSLGLTPSQFAPDCPADVGAQGGVPGHDCVLDNNDMAVFMGYLLNNDPRGDIAGQGPVAGADGVVNNNDEILFFDLFYFSGCP